MSHSKKEKRYVIREGSEYNGSQIYIEGDTFEQMFPRLFCEQDSKTSFLSNCEYFI